jgi:hypothetical protein
VTAPPKTNIRINIGLQAKMGWRSPFDGIFLLEAFSTLA